MNSTSGITKYLMKRPNYENVNTKKLQTYKVFTYLLRVNVIPETIKPTPKISYHCTNENSFITFINTIQIVEVQKP